MNETDPILNAIIDKLKQHPKVRFRLLVIITIGIGITLIILLTGNYFLIPEIAQSVINAAYPVFAILFLSFLTLLRSYLPSGIVGSDAFYQEKITQAESKIQNEPEKARPAWDLARITLEAYFNRNLSQVSSIFWLSVAVMGGGFIIIFFGINQAIKTPDAVAPAVIATLSGVVTEFIGATFLFVYRSTVQQAINYSKTLERINSVGMAMQILDTMPDEVKAEDLKSKTKAVLVELLVKQSYEVSGNIGNTDTSNDDKKTE